MSNKRKVGSILNFFSKETKPLADIDTSKSEVYPDGPLSLPQRETIRVTKPNSGKYSNTNFNKFSFTEYLILYLLFIILNKHF